MDGHRSIAAVSDDFLSPGAVLCFDCFPVIALYVESDLGWRGDRMVRLLEHVSQQRAVEKILSRRHLTRPTKVTNPTDNDHGHACASQLILQDHHKDDAAYQNEVEDNGNEEVELLPPSHTADLVLDAKVVLVEDFLLGAALVTDYGTSIQTVVQPDADDLVVAHDELAEAVLQVKCPLAPVTCPVHERVHAVTMAQALPPLTHVS